jgi:hypothetical protein
MVRQVATGWVRRAATANQAVMGRAGQVATVNQAATGWVRQVATANQAVLGRVAMGRALQDVARL